MNDKLFWQNFNLGIELSISGNFIYNSLKCIDEMESFYYPDTIFDFYYNISVGIERLEKIAIILLEYDNEVDQTAFDEKIKTHNHMTLLERIKKETKINFESIHYEFLKILNNFYKNIRYDRFSLSDCDNNLKEKKELLSFISKHLNIEFKENYPFLVPRNSSIIKIFIGQVIEKIVLTLYDVIYNQSHKKRIFTYEIRIESKAFKIFIRKEFNFIKEKLLLKELLIFLINNKFDEDIINHIVKLDSLDFEPEMIQEYIYSFFNDKLKLRHLDLLDHFYQNINNKNERMCDLDIIGDPYIVFDDEK